MNTADSTQRDPAEIEREIRNTQAEMSRTVDKIGDQLTPRNIVNGLLDKADEKGIDARYLVDGARRNPIALAMIALGGIWLVSDSDAKASSLKPSGLPSFGGGSSKSAGWTSHDDDHHRGYIEHMSKYEPQADEGPDAYRRRRDMARANYLMIEQRHDEDESSFRQRLDQATDALRQRRHDMMDHARNFGSSAAGGARSAASKTGDLYTSNPLAGGFVAALVGALAGAAAPITRTEEEQVGKLGASALDAAKGKASELADLAREKKDELVEKADQRMSDAGSGGTAGGTTTGSSGTSGTGSQGSDPAIGMNNRSPEFGSV